MRLRQPPLPTGRTALIRLLIGVLCMLAVPDTRGADEADLLFNPVGFRHVDRIAEILGADQAQTEAILALHAGYRRNVLDLRKSYRQERAARHQANNARSAQPDEAAEKRADFNATYDVVDAVDALTRGFFADLGTLAGPHASAKVEAAERFHRRRVGGRLTVCGPERADLIELAREVGVTRSAAFNEAMAEYELRFDDLMQRKQRRVRSLFEELAEADIKDSPPISEAIGEVLRKLTGGSIEIRDFNVRQARILRDLLPEAEQAAWTRAFNTKSYPHVYGRDLTADAYAKFRSMEGLDADQLEAIDRIHERYRNEAVGADARYVTALNRRHEALSKANVVAFMDEIDKRPDIDDLTRAIDDRNSLAAACVKRMADVLTGEQRVGLKDPPRAETASKHDDLMPLGDGDEDREQWREAE